MIHAQTRSGRFARPLRAVALGAAALLVGAVFSIPHAAYAAASIALSQNCGPSEVGLTVSGSGLAEAQRGVWVIVERPNGDAVDSRTVPVDGNGSYSIPFGLDISRSGTPLPSAVRVGLYADNRLIASTWYFIGCPYMRVQPIWVERKSEPLTIAVALTGFVPGVPVRVSIPGLATPPAQVPNTKDGNRFTFPDYPGCGAVTVTATQATVDDRPPTPPIGLTSSPVTRRAGLSALPNWPSRTATAAMGILCSTLEATPATFPDTALPATTVAKGVQFGTQIPVDLLFDDVKIGEAQAQKDLTFTQPVKLPRTTCGGHRLTAMQVITLGGRDLRINAAAADTITVYAETTITVTCAKADLAITPEVTEGGRLVQAIGGRFVPGRTVKLEWVDVDAEPIADIGTVTVDADGTFTYDALLLPNSDLGPRRLHALEQPAAGDTRGAREGFADLLVVPGTMQRGRTRFLERE